ncbi:MAG TPA: DUF5752 family protein [Candidatus Limnocylindrales bacterium]|nr:DUF5752 family protein [Candidatus Limnocylindrales bacterium]
MSKINPGSNVNEDNDLRTATPGAPYVDIPEPKIVEKGKFQCPVCDTTYRSREDYISHAMALHQVCREAPIQECPMITGVQLLNSVQYEKGFHFFTGLGNYTGVTATSLSEFAKDLDTVPGESVRFHFQRGDYQRWLIDVVGDEELARRIDMIEMSPMSSDEDLRRELSKTVKNRIAELSQSLK